MKRLFVSILMFILLIPALAIVISTVASAERSTGSDDYPTERAALMSLYDSTDGGVWYENGGWGSADSYCTWYGVTCDSSNHVLYLELVANWLAGPIPAEIDDLVALQILDLSGNLLSGPLPEELGNLTQLQLLALSYNGYCLKGCGRSLGGAIPASLGKLTNLQRLDLSNNVLEGAIPAQLGDLAQLQSLDLSGNYFCTSDYFSGERICHGGLYGVIPAELSSLSALEALSLEGNKSLCWETVAARSWALTLPLYAGPTDCSYMPLTPSLHFAKSAGRGSLTFAISAVPHDGSDFTFDLSGPANPTTPTLLDKWGGQGSGDGQFFYAAGVALDTAGNVYVADARNNRIQKFDKDGVFLTKWGSEGSGDGQFNGPAGVALDTAGNVYVADTGNNRIQKFDRDGIFITKWGSEGSGDGQFNSWFGVAADAAGNVYVADTGNARIQKFDRDGIFITKWGSEGSGDGQFNYPAGVAADAVGNVYVADSDNNRIQKFDQDGVFLAKWGSEGSGDGQFGSLAAVAVDVVGNIYVAEHEHMWGGNNRIQKFDQNGAFMIKWGSEGSGDGQFDFPAGMAADTAGSVYVADSGNHRIQKFLATGFVLDDAGPDDGDAVGNSVFYDKLPAGRYRVTERAVNGWELKELTCIGTNSYQVTADLVNRAVTIDLAEEEHITCMFTNRLQPEP